MTEHTVITDLTAEVLTALLPEWQLALRAENKSPGTIEVYADGARRYLRWCPTHRGRPDGRDVPTHLDGDHAGAAPGDRENPTTRGEAARRWLIATRQLAVAP